jgi:hypothetical protein
VADQIAAAISNRALLLDDYNAQLHLTFYFWRRGNQPLTQQFPDQGLSQVPHALATAPSSRERYLVLINAHVLDMWITPTTPKDMQTFHGFSSRLNITVMGLIGGADLNPSTFLKISDKRLKRY